MSDARKCLAFLALPGVGNMPTAGEDEKEAARVFYVAATRATQMLVMGAGGEFGFGIRWGLRCSADSISLCTIRQSFSTKSTIPN
jgi:hypothetical protein